MLDRELHLAPRMRILIRTATQRRERHCSRKLALPGFLRSPPSRRECRRCRGWCNDRHNLSKWPAPCRPRSRRVARADRDRRSSKEGRAGWRQNRLGRRPRRVSRAGGPPGPPGPPARSCLGRRTGSETCRWKRNQGRSQEQRKREVFHTAPRSWVRVSILGDQDAVAYHAKTKLNTALDTDE